MQKIITYNFKESFIKKLAQFLKDNFSNSNNDFSRVACVFGGRRPALFLRRQLAQQIGKSFSPPTIFSIDNFIDFCLKDQNIKRLDI
jgi:hypothetical protein